MAGGSSEKIPLSGANSYGFADHTRTMDLTVFKLEIDDITLNAPFSSRAGSDDDSPDDESSGSSVKRTVGLVAALVATILGGVIALKRRLRGNETESDDPSPTTTMDEGEDETGSRRAIQALIGLFFLVLLTLVMKKKQKSGEDAPDS